VLIQLFSSGANALMLRQAAPWHDEAMTSDRLEVQRRIPADPAAIFRLLCDPQGHVIDSSGMLMSATGECAFLKSSRLDLFEQAS
jgi:hypothetical protein